MIRFERWRWAHPPIAIATLLIFTFCSTPALGGEDHWVGTWSTSPIDGLKNSAILYGNDPIGFSNQTLRLMVRTSVGGHRVRVRVSNAFGGSPLVIGEAHIAIRAGGSAIVAQSDRALTFSGSGTITIPTGALVLSDPVRLDVPPFADLAVSIYLPGDTGPATWHWEPIQTSYVSPPGDFAGSGDLPPSKMTTLHWFFLSGVDVLAAEETMAVVTLGDSITDGELLTPDSNDRWPDFLAKRLQAWRGDAKGVLNQGISGNQVLNDLYGQSALARFDRDVLGQAGVSHVVVLEGINDIGIPGYIAGALAGIPPQPSASTDDIIAGHRQLITRAHERGLRIFGGTLTPWIGSRAFYPGYGTPEGEIMRQAINAWIRTSGEYDAVIDFDAAVRDPEHPERFLPAYDGGDHLHPSAAGYKAMADAIDLQLFEEAGR